MLVRIKNGDATPMDLDIMSSVCEQIMGNCLCVLGDAMAMPVGSMIKHFRPEFEAYIEAKREEAGFGVAIPQVNRGAQRRPEAAARTRRGRRLMPRPEVKTITFTLDGREVEAPEGMMLVDAAKYGDVEIPVFCYEPKLGQPVGACRMCLVEIEGIPKLQTACSTPIRDGMVVHTQTAARARRAARGGRVPADQPPARLPGLRQGRRVPAAGHHLRLGPRDVAASSSPSATSRSRSSSRR